ncbi:hypothetical protein CCHR01_09158 [Colletotrichum chrysophilum]|uniref:Uncharacterized protein n=1 Tax=Colletotrichum chrysophilum TaxID=1836956 RepID=A0AAD9AIG8_9PEZI|nr:hypothetical protein CCHR01_09158 [Colletotrichum chrysophilum]
MSYQRLKLYKLRSGHGNNGTLCIQTPIRSALPLRPSHHIAAQWMTDRCRFPWEIRWHINWLLRRH